MRRAVKGCVLRSSRVETAKKTLLRFFDAHTQTRGGGPKSLSIVGLLGLAHPYRRVSLKAGRVTSVTVQRPPLAMTVSPSEKSRSVSQYCDSPLGKRTVTVRLWGSGTAMKAISASALKASTWSHMRRVLRSGVGPGRRSPRRQGEVGPNPLGDPAGARPLFWKRRVDSSTEAHRHPRSHARLSV